MLPEAHIVGVNETIKKGLFTIWTNDRIKNAFNYGNGTKKDFDRYKKDNNGRYCLIKEITKNDLMRLYPNIEL